VNFFKRIELSDEMESYLNKLKNKIKKKFVKKTEEEEKMNIDEESNSISQKNNNEIIKKMKNEDEMWRVGIVCKKECYYLTQEILKILEKNGYEWKIISTSYKIKCRKRQNNEAINNSNSINTSVEPEASPLNILIQIFGEVDPEKKDEFLVDLHKLSGPVMEFLEFSSVFISAIQKQGLIVLK
jgi:hypothetical protein